MLGHLVEQSRQLTIVDMEASVEHMGRGTPRHSDVMLIVTEPYYRSLDTAGRMAPLARDLGIKQVYVVANKVRNARDEEAIRQYCKEHDMEIIAVLPFDDEVLSADNAGTPILDAASNSRYVEVVRQLQQKLGESVAQAV